MSNIDKVDEEVAASAKHPYEELRQELYGSYSDLDSSNKNEPASLEGIICCRKTRSLGSRSKWNKYYVVLNLMDGSISCYEPSFGNDRTTVEKGERRYSKLHRRFSFLNVNDTEPTRPSKPVIHISPGLPWIVKDVTGNSTTFVVEIHCNVHFSDANDFVIAPSTSEPCSLRRCHPGEESVTSRISDEISSCKDLEIDLKSAKRMKKPYRLYFKCTKGGNEKALWLKAFSRLGRFSSTFRTKRGLLSTLKSPVQKAASRIRSPMSAVLSREFLHLDSGSVGTNPISHEELLSRSREGGHKRGTLRKHEKEYRVKPFHVYPHRWMTGSELREQMMLPSTTFHDLRAHGNDQKEIGSLQVEVLQCLGLPKLDRTSETDAVVYLVCGQYAFATDCIPNEPNPMWLRTAQRACRFPIHHGYARLYVGVFDDEQEGKDDFNGRVVLNLSQLRHGSTYDVTLPLRLSSHVYSRRRRGAIRLRFVLRWNSEKEALLSYIPQSPKDLQYKNNFGVMCGDARAFRNVAITVHGAHLPGRFSFQHFRATLREINFTRKSIIRIIRSTLRETREWQNPVMSGFVFLAWMHCIYLNLFSLVPAYVMLFFMLHLVRNYAKYGIDGENQQGFIPPSWEEMLSALLLGAEKGVASIRPLILRRLGDSSNPDAEIVYSTHQHIGKALFRTLGFLSDDDLSGSTHSSGLAEFPFANPVTYPKFKVADCVVARKKSSHKIQNNEAAPTPGHENRSQRRFSLPLDMEMPMRKDNSGMYEYDQEEQNFTASRFIRKTGTIQLAAAANGLIDVGSGFTEVTGLKRVTPPIARPITRGVKSSYHHVVPPLTSGIKTGITQVVSPIQQRVSNTVNLMRHVGDDVAEQEDRHDSDSELASIIEDEALIDLNRKDLVPDQNIDFDGSNSGGKKVTDDLADVKEKMHEFAGNLFKDKVYELEDGETCYFGKAQQTTTRKLSKKFDKLLQVGQFSHANPVVARFGLYVEPLVGASHSIINAFRSLFNIMTWRDPFLSFWISLLGFGAVILLFLFPWRLFLFTVGVWFVGPQNWVIRVFSLGGSTSSRKKKSQRDATLRTNEFNVDENREIFRGHMSQGQQPKALKPVDAREAHRVLVPYSPLMYQRFYDWPPEPQYAEVTQEVISGEDAKFDHFLDSSDLQDISVYTSDGLCNSNGNHFRLNPEENWRCSQ